MYYINNVSFYIMKLMDGAKSLKNSINPTPFPRGHTVTILMCMSEKFFFIFTNPSGPTEETWYCFEGVHGVLFQHKQYHTICVIAYLAFFHLRSILFPRLYTQIYRFLVTMIQESTVRAALVYLAIPYCWAGSQAPIFHYNKQG